MSEEQKPLKSGDKVKTAAGVEAELPYADEHPCFGQRQGWCTNLATWRRETSHTLLHFCDECKRTKPQLSPEDSTWTKLEPRPNEETKSGTVVTWTPPKFKAFKKAYEKHKAESKDPFKESFMFDGLEYVGGYAKYLIEYLEPKMKE